MNHIFLDFEMNPIPKKNKALHNIAQSEIIEIGAVKLDENYKQIDSFSIYVKPEYNEIAKNITSLTGITNNDVEGALKLDKALELFLEWIGKESVRIYSWSDSDRRQLFQECKLKSLYIQNMPKPFRRWMDFQKIYTRLVGLSRRSNLSLKNAMGAVDEAFSGAQHRAIDDAINSAALLRLVEDKDAFQERIKVISQFLGKDDTQKTTLGDIFGDLLSF